MSRRTIYLLLCIMVAGCGTTRQHKNYRDTSPPLLLHPSCEARLLDIYSGKHIVYVSTASYVRIGDYDYLLLKFGIEPDWDCEESLSHYQDLIRKHRDEPDWSRAKFVIAPERPRMPTIPEMQAATDKELRDMDFHFRSPFIKGFHSKFLKGDTSWTNGVRFVDDPRHMDEEE
jgi:hypothetical protein